VLLPGPVFAAMVWYLVARHPVLVRELGTVPMGSDEAAAHA
jgi:hypothetical protein